MNIAAKLMDSVRLSGVSALPEQSYGDIILRVLIGIVLVTALIWLAAVIAGKIGSRFHPGGWFAEDGEPVSGGDTPDADGDDENRRENTEIENNDIGGNING